MKKMKHAKKEARARGSARKLAVLALLAVFLVGAVLAVPASAALISMDSVLEGIQWVRPSQNSSSGLILEDSGDSELTGNPYLDGILDIGDAENSYSSSLFVSTMMDLGPEELGGTTANVPILMYHSFTSNPSAVTNAQIPIGLFLSQISALYAAGYETISYEQLYDYVRNGTPLPEKPVIISMDDGYKNNLDLAAPILQQYGYCAEISIIGCSVGRSNYKTVGVGIIPHFTLQQAQGWINAGVINLHSHSYDMHQLPTLDGQNCRKGVLPLSTETYSQYRDAFKADYAANKSLLDQVGGEDVQVFTYPYGSYNQVTEQVLDELNVPISVTTRSGIAKVTCHDLSSLRLLPRLSVTDQTTADALLAMLG